MTPNPSSESSVVPRNYDELYRQYGPLIYKLLLKYNKIERNFEDLHGYVWVKILEAKLLDRFQAYVQRQRPKVLSAIDACDVLGVSWPQWLAAMSAYHVGHPFQNKDGHLVAFRLGHWMPTPINLAEFEASGRSGHLEPTALFAFSDIVRLSEMENGFKVMGRDVRGGILFGETREERIKLPIVKVTKTQFKNYLTMAVLNHYANFCRTQDRRHKERPYIAPAYMHEDDAPTWESTLQDTKSADSDTMIALSEARQLLSETLHECSDGVDLCRPIEEHETDVFELLEEGLSLIQALKQSNLPQKVCRQVLEAVRPLGPEFS